MMHMHDIITAFAEWPELERIEFYSELTPEILNHPDVTRRFIREYNVNPEKAALMIVYAGGHSFLTVGFKTDGFNPFETAKNVMRMNDFFNSIPMRAIIPKSHSVTEYKRSDFQRYFNLL